MDALSIVEGTIRRAGALDAPLDVTLKVVYANRGTQSTFGTCMVPTALLQKRTMETLQRFIEQAEEDFGHIIFGGDGLTLKSEPEQAEVNAPLKGLGE